MLIPQVFLSFCKFSFFSSFFVTCNREFARHRTEYRQAMENNANLFVAVAFVPMVEGRASEISVLRKKVESYKVEVKMPMFLVQPSNKTEVTYLKMVTNTFFAHQSPYNMKTFFNSSINSSKLYIFETGNSLMTETEVLFFHSCLMHKDSSESIITEEVYMIITEGFFNETVINQILSKKLQNVEPFNFDEFKVTDFYICQHLEYYVYECEDDDSIYSFLLMILIIFVVLFAKKVVSCLKLNLKTN